MWFCNLQAATCELRVASYNFKKIKIYELRSNCTSWKFILRVGNKSTSCKLLFTGCNFKEISLRVAGCVLRVERSKR